MQFKKEINLHATLYRKFIKSQQLNQFLKIDNYKTILLRVA